MADDASPASNAAGCPRSGAATLAVLAACALVLDVVQFAAHVRPHVTMLSVSLALASIEALLVVFVASVTAAPVHRSRTLFLAMLSGVLAVVNVATHAMAVHDRHYPPPKTALLLALLDYGTLVLAGFLIIATFRCAESQQLAARGGQDEQALME